MAGLRDHGEEYGPLCCDHDRMLAWGKADGSIPIEQERFGAVEEFGAVGLDEKTVGHD
jgi:hypothetical protein